MKLNHFSSKRKGWGGDRLAGRPARDERILKAGWQRRFTQEAGRGGGGGGDGIGGQGGPTLQTVAWRSRVSTWVRSTCLLSTGTGDGGG